MYDVENFGENRSAKQISKPVMQDHPDDPGMRVSYDMWVSYELTNGLLPRYFRKIEGLFLRAHGEP